MGIGNVQHMDVIPDAGSVRGGIVRPKNIDVRQNSARGIKNARDEMSFYAVMLAELFGGSGGVEIAQGHILQLGVGIVIGQDLLENELGFSVGIDGRFWMFFRDGNHLGFAVSGGGRRKNKFLYPVTGDGIQQIHAAGYVGSVENAGLAHGFGDQSLGSKVHHGINLVLGENAFDLGAISKINLAKDRTLQHGRTMTFNQAVERNDAHSARQQDFRADAANVARRSCDENIHVSVLPQ